jgi:hypothetical protein
MTNQQEASREAAAEDRAKLFAGPADIHTVEDKEGALAKVHAKEKSPKVRDF